MTGASSGIGKRFQLNYQKYSKHIYIIARSINKLEEVHDSIIQNECGAQLADLTGQMELKTYLSNIKKEKAIDILMLSAG